MTHVLSLQITARRLIAESILLLDLRSVDGTPLPAFTAGSHLRLSLPGGRVRAYSICNDPQQRSVYQLAVQLDPSSRGGSRSVHEQLRTGDTVQVNGPHNLFPLDETASHSVLLAGGIGITPLMSMAHRLHTQGLSWELHYACRSPERCAFMEELTSGPLAEHVYLHFDNGAPAQRLEVADVLAGAPKGTHLYVCGPAGFIDAVMANAQTQKWPENQLHSERFTAAQAEVSPREETAFRVVLARSGMTLDVPVGSSVLSVIRRAGIDLPASCEQGVCGTCITDVLSGRPDHRDQCLDEDMRSRCFTPCCSRSLDDCLTIDL